MNLTISDHIQSLLRDALEHHPDFEEVMVYFPVLNFSGQVTKIHDNLGQCQCYFRDVDGKLARVKTHNGDCIPDMGAHQISQIVSKVFQGKTISNL
jgi:hypothetical protein